jgi:hypothetical protein
MKRAPSVLSLCVLLGILLAAAAIPAGAFDWGGNVDNSTTVTVTASDPPTAYPEEEIRLALWLEALFGKAGSLFAQGSYTLTVEPLEDPAVDHPLLFDVDLLRYDVRLSSLFDLSAGRFAMADFSRFVLDDTLDGVQVRANFPWSVMTAYVGTSALRFIPNTTIVMSGNDASDALNPDKLLAPPRLMEGLQAVFPELFLRQDLTASLVFQQDLRAQVIQEGEETQFPGGLADGPVNTQYFGAGLSGPLAPALYYRAFGYLETGSHLAYLADSASGTGFSYQRQILLAGLAGAEVAYFLPQVMHSRVALSALFSRDLIPISQPTFTLVYSPRFGDILTADLSYSLKPFAGSPKLWLRELQGELTVATYVQTVDVQYLGTEIDAAVDYRLFSDLGLALTLGLYLPGGAAAQFGGQFEFSFAF